LTNSCFPSVVVGPLGDIVDIESDDGDKRTARAWRRRCGGRRSELCGNVVCELEREREGAGEGEGGEMERRLNVNVSETFCRM